MKRMQWLVVFMAVLALCAWGCGDKEETAANTAADGTETAEGGEATGPKLDINIATLEEIDALDGVKPAVAAAIIKFREEHNGFTSVEQLNDVKGVGDVLMAKLRPLVMCGATIAPATGGSEGGEEEAAVEGEAAAGAEEASADGKPSINSATAAQIKAAGGRMALATAEAIIEAREAAGGKFTSWEQIDEVDKVGPSTLEKLQAAFSLAGASSGSSTTSSTATSSSSSSASTGSSTSGGKVNLNTATVEQLDALPRVSPSVAQAIVDARNALPGKKFRTWDQVDAVAGVGPSLFEKLKTICTL